MVPACGVSPSEAVFTRRRMLLPSRLTGVRCLERPMEYDRDGDRKLDRQAGDIAGRA
jgi:hypothetical protein